MVVHRGVLLFVLLLGPAGAAAAAQSSAWTDRVSERWNQPGARIPAPAASSEPQAALAKRCAPFVTTEGAAAAALQRAGWTPFLHLDRRLDRDDVEVVGGMTAATPDCQAASFNLFVFVAGRFAGTLSPAPMIPGRDGAAGAVRLTAADALTAEFARYTPADTECCPSSVLRVTYRIDRTGAAPVVEAIDTRRVR